MEKISAGKQAALNLIAQLSHLDETARAAVFQSELQNSSRSALMQLATYGNIQDLLNIPTSREDFDRIYKVWEEHGKDGREVNRNDADYYRELMTNPNPVGIEFVTSGKAVRLMHPQIIKMLDTIAIRENIPHDQVDRLLSQHLLDADKVPGPDLTEDEKEYMRVRQDVVHKISEHYQSSYLMAPRSSPWRQRLEEQAKSNDPSRSV